MNDGTGLMDVESIKQLKARYCRYLDTKDWARWRDLFTDDFVGDTTEAGEDPMLEHGRTTAPQATSQQWL